MTIRQYVGWGSGLWHSSFYSLRIVRTATDRIARLGEAAQTEACLLLVILRAAILVLFLPPVPEQVE